jgi:hypothetical protein
MKKVAFVWVLYKDVYNRLQKVFLYQVHDKGLIFGFDDRFIEFDDPEVKELGLEPLQPSDPFDYFLLYCKDSEPECMLLRALGDKLYHK